MCELNPIFQVTIGSAKFIAVQMKIFLETHYVLFLGKYLFIFRTNVNCQELHLNTIFLPEWKENVRHVRLTPEAAGWICV